jgi:hypothetical protein
MKEDSDGASGRSYRCTTPFTTRADKTRPPKRTASSRAPDEKCKNEASELSSRGACCLEGRRMAADEEGSGKAGLKPIISEPLFVSARRDSESLSSRTPVEPLLVRPVRERDSEEESPCFREALCCSNTPQLRSPAESQHREGARAQRRSASRTLPATEEERHRAQKSQESTSSREDNNCRASNPNQTHTRITGQIWPSNSTTKARRSTPYFRAARGAEPGLHTRESSNSSTALLEN